MQSSKKSNSSSASSGGGLETLLVAASAAANGQYMNATNGTSGRRVSLSGEGAARTGSTMESSKVSHAMPSSSTGHNVGWEPAVPYYTYGNIYTGYPSTAYYSYNDPSTPSRVSHSQSSAEYYGAPQGPQYHSYNVYGYHPSYHRASSTPYQSSAVSNQGTRYNPIYDEPGSSQTWQPTYPKTFELPNLKTGSSNISMANLKESIKAAQLPPLERFSAPDSENQIAAKLAKRKVSATSVTAVDKRPLQKLKKSTKTKVDGNLAPNSTVSAKKSVGKKSGQPTKKVASAKAIAVAGTIGLTAQKGNAAFVQQLFTMIGAEPDSIVHWTPDGKSFVIADLDCLQKESLAKYFRKKQADEFFRRLDLFKFEKIPASHGIIMYRHSLFQRDRPELLKELSDYIRGIHKAAAAKKVKKLHDVLSESEEEEIPLSSWATKIPPITTTKGSQRSKSAASPSPERKQSKKKNTPSEAKKKRPKEVDSSPHQTKKAKKLAKQSAKVNPDGNAEGKSPTIAEGNPMKTPTTAKGNSIKTDDPTHLRAYLCKKCGVPKKGHVCDVSKPLHKKELNAHLAKRTVKGAGAVREKLREEFPTKPNFQNSEAMENIRPRGQWLPQFQT